MKRTCKDCPRRFPGCHDRCPDYAAWKAEYDEAKAREKEYNKRVREDFFRSEECRSGKEKWM